ncbi:replication-associated recombination protein A [Actinomyces vulturis]|uniref:replication-associated recombination protein A n=1 Tax=Actinomyces vulturis TaxID=1857645 RepID=UPI00082EDD73|nr:replication-associated recombination protein A [Actinomyces vulturis]
MDLFEAVRTDESGVNVDKHAPLAVRMRPRTIDEVVGQQHLLHPGSPLQRLIDPTPQAGAPSSIILWGPPGTGKTTLAYLVARAGGRRFVELSALTAGVKDVRAVVDSARRTLMATGEETVLFIDEVHRFSRTQQDSLLPSVENRWVTLVAATTENPSFCVVSPLLSRSLLLTLQPLDAEDIRALINRAISDERGLDASVAFTEDAIDHILRIAGSDARKALTIVEACAEGARGTVPIFSQSASGEDNETVTRPTVSLHDVEQAADIAAVAYDRAGDQHYDVASALIKSMRGSDVDAALHYLARMLVAGEDPRFIARRIVIAASEDVGMADPTALGVATSAMQAVGMIGMPEARIILSQAVIAVATAPKSNAAYKAINEAIGDVKAGRGGAVPVHLRDAHYVGAEALGHGKGYIYAHDCPHGIASQEYMPEDLKGREYYTPTTRGHEELITRRLANVRSIIHQR